MIAPLTAGATGMAVLTVAQLVLAYLRHAESYYQKNGEVTDEFGCIKSAVSILSSGNLQTNPFPDQSTMCSIFAPIVRPDGVLQTPGSGLPGGELTTRQ